MKRKEQMWNLMKSMTLATCFSLWLSHITVCLFQGKLLLLFVGAFLFPVGIIHGALVLLGKM